MIKGITHEEMKNIKISGPVSGKVEIWKYFPTNKTFEKEEDLKKYMEAEALVDEKRRKAREKQREMGKKATLELPIVQKELNKEKDKLISNINQKLAFIKNDKDVIFTVQQINDSKTAIKKHELTIKVCNRSLINRRKDLGKEYDKLHSSNRNKVNSLRKKIDILQNRIYRGKI